MLEKQAQNILGNDLNVNIGKLSYKLAVVSKCIEENICEKFTVYFEINVYHKSTRIRNLLLKVSKVRMGIRQTGFLFWRC